jgi:hypothetical protein
MNSTKLAANPAAQTVRWLKAAALVALVFVAAVGAHLRIRDLHDIGVRSPDERVYTAFARQLVEKGWPAMPQFFRATCRIPEAGTIRPRPV